MTPLSIFEIASSNLKDLENFYAALIEHFGVWSIISIYFTAILTCYNEFVVSITTRKWKNDPVPFDIE